MRPKPRAYYVGVIEREERVRKGQIRHALESTSPMNGPWLVDDRRGQRYTQLTRSRADKRPDVFIEKSARGLGVFRDKSDAGPHLTARSVRGDVKGYLWSGRGRGGRFATVRVRVRSSGSINKGIDRRQREGFTSWICVGWIIGDFIDPISH
jgi:hypothetical protein